MRRKVCVLLIYWIILLISGCETPVRPIVKQWEFETDEAKIPANIALHITDKFRTYCPGYFDWTSDAVRYKMELGPFASDWFRYALESRFSNVSLVFAEPQFPYPEEDVDFIVTPEFASFQAGGPLIVKSGKYWIELRMNIDIRDKDGDNLAYMKLKQKGSQAGTTGTIGTKPGINLYPNICRMALKPIVDKTIEKIIELNNIK